ncbi:MAG: ABC transporter permease [Cyanobacteria bacterium P01_H01_bin.15]
MTASVDFQSYNFTARRYFEILWVLVQRDLKVRYRGSILGVLWSLLKPLTMTLLYTAVLGTTLADLYDNSIWKYALSAFVGLATFEFFSDSTMQAMASIVTRGQLLNKIRLPASVFPAAAITNNVAQFCLATFPLLAIIAVLSSGQITPLLALLVPLSALVFMSLGVGYIMSTMYVFFRDIPYFYGIFVYALRIATPVFYDIRIVPEHLRPLIEINPLSQIIQSVRQIVLSGETLELEMLYGAFLGSLVVCVLGRFIFIRMRPHFMDLL